jgi:hypothetical protein
MDGLQMANPEDFDRRPQAVRTGIEAYQVAAWRAPGATRFDGRPANDDPANDHPTNAFLARAEAIAPLVSTPPVQMEPMPRWLVVVIGGVISAIMGALLGGALSVY